MKGKNKKRAFETFEFIEDIRVDEFLKNEFPEYHSEITKITEFFNVINKQKESEDIKNNSKKIFSNKFVSEIKTKREELRNKILNTDPDRQRRNCKNSRYYL